MIKRHFHRRNLPHLYYNEGMYFITYRLYGSIHPNELKMFHDWQLKLQKNLINHKKIFKKYDSFLDKPQNEVQFLKKPEVMEICRQSLHFYNEKLYNLICYCIMPNHVHLVFDLLNNQKDVGEIMGSIKKYSARRANKIINQEGPFWQAESYDRLIRDDVELYFVIRYVLNPGEAGLVQKWTEWTGTYCNQSYVVLD